MWYQNPFTDIGYCYKCEAHVYAIKLEIRIDHPEHVERLSGPTRTRLCPVCKQQIDNVIPTIHQVAIRYYLQPYGIFHVSAGNKMLIAVATMYPPENSAVCEVMIRNGCTLLDGIKLPLGPRGLSQDRTLSLFDVSGLRKDVDLLSTVDDQRFCSLPLCRRLGRYTGDHMVLLTERGLVSS